MPGKKKSTCLPALTCLLLILPAIGSAECYEDDVCYSCAGCLEREDQCAFDTCCIDDCCPCYWDGYYPHSIIFRRHQGDGIGFVNSYTTAQILNFIRTGPNSSFMVDLRAHYFDNNEWAGNVGVGWRQEIFDCCTGIGINFYYDWRLDRGHTFHQLGVGIEILGECVIWRFNGYYPFWDRSDVLGRCCFEYEGDYFAKSKDYQKSLRGMDVTAEIALFRCGCNAVWLGLAPYYYNNICDDTWGGRGFFRADFGGCLSAKIIVSYDNTFKTRMAGEIALTIPLGGTHCNDSGSPCGYYRPVERQEIIALDRQCKWKWNW